jgi:uncharacterized protein (DUF488 family)
MPTLFTVGHSTRSFAELASLLAEHRIALLVDVRRFPGSRRHPQFSRDTLAASLDAAGIGYLHESDLGGRRAPQTASPNTAWRVAAFRGYADWMAQPPFHAALARLLGHAREQPVVILCAEAVPWRCHRRLIADAAVVRGLEVVHLLAPGRSQRHELDANARLVPLPAAEGAPAEPAMQLVYDRGAAPELPFAAPPA